MTFEIKEEIKDLLDKAANKIDELEAQLKAQILNEEVVVRTSISEKITNVKSSVIAWFRSKI